MSTGLSIITICDEIDMNVCWVLLIMLNQHVKNSMKIFRARSIRATGTFNILKMSTVCIVEDIVR